MWHRFRYFIASRMLAVHAAYKSPSSKRALQKFWCLLCVIIIPPWRVRPQLTPEEDFGKKPKCRVKSLKREKFPSYYYNFSLAGQIFLPLFATYSKKEDLETPTVLPSSIGMQQVKHGPVVYFNHKLVEFYTNCQLGRSLLREICLK